ncbi:MAG: hypothetical protein H7832_02500 [Magnetococcus sp. DMHC-6]
MSVELFERKDALTCPVCGGHPVHIYRCTDCGEVRCGSQRCTGSGRRELAWWAGPGVQCRNCGTGRYRMMLFVSQEMNDFIMDYRLRKGSHALPLRCEAA